MRKYIKVEGSQTLVRDINSNAILNTDTATINAAREAKRLRQSRNNEVVELRNEVREMKDLINKLIEKL
jgi:hypothetical protein